MEHSRAQRSPELAGSDLDDLLETVTRAAVQLLGLRGCRIYLRNEGSGAFERRAAFPATHHSKDRSSGIVRAHTGSSDAIPMTVDGVVDGVMLIDGDGPLAPVHRDLAGVLAAMTAMLVSQNQTVTSERIRTGAIRLRNEQLRLAIALDELLMAGLAQQLSVPELAAAAGRLTARPILIYDENWRLVARAGIDPTAAVDVGAKVRHSRTRMTSNGRVSITDATARGRGLAIAPFAGVDCPGGAVVVVEHGPTVTALDAHVAQRVANTVAVSLSLDRRLRVHREAALISLVRDLADARHDIGEVGQRARDLDVDLESDWFAVVSTRESIDAVRELSAARQILWAEIDDEIAILISADDGANAPEALSRALRVSAGVSQLCSGAQGCRVAIHRARTAAHRARARASEAGGDAESAAVAESELGVVEQFLYAHDPASAQLFARQLLGRLLEDGPSASRALLATLNVFFACDRSVRRTARRLGVHENTVRKRLEVVDRLTGLDVLRSAGDQLQAQIALAIVASEPA
jgi:hypothetical protein